MFAMDSSLPPWKYSQWSYLHLAFSPWFYPCEPPPQTAYSSSLLFHTQRLKPVGLWSDVTLSWDTKREGLMFGPTTHYNRTPNINNIIPMMLCSYRFTCHSPESLSDLPGLIDVQWLYSYQCFPFLFFFIVYLRTKLLKQNSKYSVCTFNCVCRACLWHIYVRFPIYAFPFEKPLPSQVRNSTKSSHYNKYGVCVSQKCVCTRCVYIYRRQNICSI